METDLRSRDEFLPQELLEIYDWMRCSRELDDRELIMKKNGKSHFSVSAAGHEAVQVAVALNLRPGRDWFYPYYRDRATCLVLGLTPLDMLLQAVAAAADPNSGGRQMPSHWSSAALHIVSPSSCTTTQCLQAVGCAEVTVRFRHSGPLLGRQASIDEDEVTCVSLGEGATSGGEFYESLNAASLLRLPLVYLVQDNGLAISVPVAEQTAGGDISRLVQGFPDLKVITVDGTDFLKSFSAAREAINWARQGRGPALIHAKVERLYDHSSHDDQRNYRSPEEIEAARLRDPIEIFKSHLLSTGVATEEYLLAKDRSIKDDLRALSDHATAAPKPTPESAAKWVFSPDVDPTSEAFSTIRRPEGAEIDMLAAINRTLKDEIPRNLAILILGEDVADCGCVNLLETLAGQGGVFRATKGLQKLDKNRVFNTPIAEGSISGRAIGMATRGVKPVVEIQFFDYIWPAMMQIRNEMGMMRYRSANGFSCPMVVRVPIGGYVFGSLYHSQSGESIFAHCPGIRVVFPSNAADAVGLLRTAIRCDDPVLFLEHKHLYHQPYAKAPYPGPDYMIPFGQANLVREGDDAVIITWGALVQKSIEAALQADDESIHVGVLDLRTIAPCDWDSIETQVRRTNRVIVAHEDQLTCGFGAEIAAWIGTELFYCLDAPVQRVGAKDTPVPYARELENVTLPQTADILTAIRTVMRGESKSQVA